MSLTIKSIEYYLPENVVTNDDLQEEHPDWHLETIAEKAGVYQRHIAGVRETAYDLSVRACERLFEKVDKSGIDGIICCTQTPDYIIPANSFLLHDHFRLRDTVFAYDFNHACTGFIYGLAMAHGFIAAGMAKEVLLVNADTYSKYINHQDRATRVLFGDGASAVLLSESSESRGIIGIDLRTSGSGYDKFWIPAGGQRLPSDGTTSVEMEDERANIRSQDDIAMDGLGVWSFINSVVPTQIRHLLRENHLAIGDIDQFIFHQASLMTLESLKRILGLEDERVFINIRNIGNTVSASIPIALREAVERNVVGTGSRVVLSGFGAGLSYGAVLMEL